MPLSKASRLFWLGRYYERVAATLTYLWSWYDKMIDGTPPDCKAFCQALEISYPYSGTEEFLQNYVFDISNPESLRAAADRMLGNGMMLRETIGSRTLSYLELAAAAMDSGIGSISPTLSLQRTLDYIMAFRGCYDDYITDVEVRNIIKCGASVERLSIYLRLDWQLEQVPAEAGHLIHRTRRARLSTDPGCLQVLENLPDSTVPLDKGRVLAAAEQLISL